MKCPKCKLVTFDHLSKCPRCEPSFDLSRRLTRRRARSNRRIVLPATGSDEARSAAANAAASQTAEGTEMLETGAHVETPPIPEPALAEPVVLAEEPELLSGTEARAEQELPPEPEPVAAGLEAAPALKIAPLISAPQTASPEALSSQSLPSQGLPSEGPAPDLAVPPESSSAAATPVETTAAMPAVEPVDPTPTAPSPQGTPSLRDLAATEQRDELEVNVAAAVTAVRTAVRTSDAPVAPEAGASVAPEAGASAAPGVDSPSTASLTIKERMVRASRARRKQRPDLVTESIDPVLPDWYEPDVDEPNGTTGSKGKSADRRQ